MVARDPLKARRKSARAEAAISDFVGMSKDLFTCGMDPIHSRSR
jgi:hypothetical protein